MKPRRLPLMLFALAGSTPGLLPAAEVATAAAGKSAPPPKSSVAQPLAPRFQQVRERIAALYQHRNEPPPPLDPRYNPFRLPGSAPLVPAPNAGDPGAEEFITPAPGPGASLALLQQGAATLKVSGIFEIGGQSHLVINARPYKEGDVVQTLVQGETVYLRLKEIAKRSVTLSLNDAEMTLKY